MEPINAPRRGWFEPFAHESIQSVLAEIKFPLENSTDGFHVRK